MPHLVVDNGRIDRTRRRKPELSVIDGDKKLVEVLPFTATGAYTRMGNDIDDAREIALQLLAMYKEAETKFDSIGENQ